MITALWFGQFIVENINAKNANHYFGEAKDSDVLFFMEFIKLIRSVELFCRIAGNFIYCYDCSPCIIYWFFGRILYF